MMPCAWLVLACCLGLTWSLTYACGFLLGVPLPLPAGRILFAFYGALAYGWALPVMFGFLTGGADRWSIPAGWIWHGCVALGLGTVAAGEGSGLMLMPFAWWVCPVFWLVSAGMACAAWRTPRAWPVRLLAACAAGGMSIALAVVWWTRALAANGLLDAVAQETALTHGVAAAALGMAVLRLRPAAGIPVIVMMVWLAVVTAVSPLVGGLGGLKGFPVPWLLVDAGAVWAWLYALPVTGLAACLWRHEPGGCLLLKSGGVVLALLAWWGALSFLWPDVAQWSLFAWYGPELWLLTGGSMLLALSERNGAEVSALRRVWLAGVGGVLLTGMAAIVASLDVLGFPSEKWPEVVSGWVGMTACLHTAAWALCLAGMWSWLRRSGNDCLLVERDGGCYISLRMAWPAAAMAAVAFACLLLHAPEQTPMEVKRPAQDAEGARIYAAEGCALCHTQVVRRSMSGRDWQTAVDRGTDPDFAYRVSEPEDVDAEFGREGAPQLGVAAVGPDLSNAVEYAAGRLEYEDAVTRSVRRAAQPREWLALHLYNPREPQFGMPWSVCPAMQGLFEKRRVHGSAPSDRALPVRTEPGWEVVPSERGERLLAYLSSLRREAPSLKREATSFAGSRSHVDPAYAANPPAVDMERLQRARAAAVMERGRSVYLGKCAICHGSDGRGDQVNYPPLAGSEWLKDKPAAEIVGIITKGLTGPITVAGKEWNSTMLPPGVTDAGDLADLMTFLRRHFGGMEQETFTAEQIEALLKELK